MQDYKHNNSATKHIQKKNRHVFIIVSVAIVLIIVFISTVKLLKKRAYVHGLHSSLEREYSELLETEKALDASVEALHDTEGIDRIIRNTYRAVKEGEELVILVPDSS